MEKKVLAIAGAVGAAFQTISVSAILYADSQGSEWLLPVAAVSGIVGAALTAAMAAYRNGGIMDPATIQRRVRGEPKPR